MSEQRNVGDPGFGTEQAPAQPAPKPLRNQPDWNEFMDPKRYRERQSVPRKPSEFGPEPKPNQSPVSAPSQPLKKGP